MTLFTRLVCLFMLATALPLSAAPDADDIPRIPFEKYRLKNGLEVLLVEDKSLPIVAVNIWYHVGAANEEPGLTGFAHLFEHMVFAATKHIPRGQADQLLEAAGASDSNGSTSFDRTNYFDTVPAHQLELALWIHSDRMGYLLDVLDQAALANQQDVVRNERRQRTENQPYGIVNEQFFAQLFPKSHPYHAVIIGSHADIQAATLGDIKKFFKTFYRPSNATLAVVGDIDKPQARKLIEKYFGPLKPGEPLPRPIVAQPRIDAEQRAVVADRVELPRVLMGWHTPAIYQPGDAELSLAGQVLGGGKSSRLYRTLVYEKQIAQEVNAYQYSLGLGSVFSIDVLARPGHTAEELEKAIDEELDKLRNAPPDAQELERGRNSLETQLVTQLERVGGRADLLNSYNHYTGDPGYLTKEIAAYRSVTAQAVQDAVRKYLPNDRRVVVWGVPGKQELGPEVPIPPPPANAPPVEALNADAPWRARPPKPGKARPLVLPKADSFQLANGLSVIHHRRAGLPLVSAQLVLRSGSAANPPGRPGLASLTADLLDEGTRTRSSTQIADQVAQLGATLGAAATPDTTAVQAFSLRKNFPAALDLLADITLNPAFAPAELERQRAARLADLVQARDNPGAVASTATLAALYSFAHPYGYVDAGTEPAVKATTRDDLLTFWNTHFRPNNAALVLTGDITREEAKSLAESRFGAWQSAPVPAVSLPEATTTAAKLVIVDKPGAPQTALRVGRVGPDRKTPDLPALEVLNAAFGGLFTSRLNTKLREEKGYTYGVRSAFRYRRGPGPFTVQTSTRTDVTGPAVAEIFKELADLAKKPVAGDELRRARDAELLSLPGQFETASAIGSSFATAFTFDLGLDYYAKLPARFKAVNEGGIRAAVARHLAPESMITVAVGDKEKILPQLEALKLGPVEYRDTDGNPLPAR